MAAPISKSVTSIFLRKSRIAAIFGTWKRYSIRQLASNHSRVSDGARFTNDDEGHFRGNGWNKIHIGIFTLAIAGYEVWRHGDSWKPLLKQTLFPVVQAANLVDNEHSSSSSGLPKDQPDGGKETSSRQKHFNFIADTVEKSAPAVVYIEIKGRHPFSTRDATVSNGSGFIVRADGLILTNAHVVANKRTVMVTLNDGRKLEGVVQAVDPITDLATIRIPAKNLPFLELADSSAVRPGEWVVAMGSPLSLSNTVTAGIVSTVHRGSKELGIHNKDMEYIQTDAVINFGNSGGPLVNLDGEAIGISTMKVTTGISFAIPANYAKEFLTKAQLLEAKQGSSWFGRKTESKRRYIGVTMLTLTPSIAAELRNRMDDFPNLESGVFVHKIVVNSPAYSGGIRPGDVVVEINRRTIQTAADVYKALETNAKLNVKVVRGRDVINLHVEAEEVN